jgi:putative intracellular protease/amidase
MSNTLRLLAYVAAVAVPPIVVGALRATQQISRYQQPPLAAPLSHVAVPAAPAHDPRKPTVAILLGADVTEVTDALGPYEIFSRAGRYNVYMVAPERRPSLLTGGLRILPHLSLADLDARLGGTPAAVVVVPNIPNIKRLENRPLLGWIRRQAAAGALLHSWCDGALALAESGVLDGRRATAHWGDIGGFERAYPKVKWVRGVRWVEDEGLVASAGINSGIDASLRVLVRRDGDTVARRVAAELRYPNFHFVQNPAAAQLEFRPSDAVFLGNAGFRVRRQRIGVALYDGVGELSVSNVYDAHVATGEVQTIATAPGVVRTQHGVTLLPSLVSSRDTGAMRALDRLIITSGRGAPPHDLAAATQAFAPSLTTVWIDRDSTRYPLESVLEDLARTTDVPSARFAERRLEYRSARMELTGSAIPWSLVPLPLAIASLGALFVWLLHRATLGRSQRNSVAYA